MATRLYPTTGTPAISPTPASGWEATGLVTSEVLTTASGSYNDNGTPLTVGSGVANDDTVVFQSIWGPISGGAITGTFQGQIGAREANGLTDARMQCTIRVIAPDGTTVRGTLLAMSTAALSSEFNIDAAIRLNRKIPLGGSASLSSVTAQAGDYIVIETGFRNHNTNTGAVRMGSQGGVGSGDLPIDETANASGFRLWYEFSQALTLTTLATPGKASLTLATFAPTVSVAVANPVATPGVLALTLTTFAPTASIATTVTPATLGLTLTTVAPITNVAPIPAPVVEARVGWRPGQFNHVTNPDFETNTSGWSVGASINGAGTSISRIATDFNSGTACGQLVCPATAGTGANFDFGSQSFFAAATYGCVYRFVVWLKSVSGTTQATITAGSLGTSSDRATKDVILTTSWQPFYIDWLPTGTRTDVELDITNTVAVAMTAYIDDVAVYWRDALTQIENGYFTTDTGGWTVNAGINAAGTSITRQSSGGFYDAPCGRLVTTGSSGSGMNWPMGTAKYTQGRTYRARVYLKSISGTTTARIRLGSSGTAGDRGDSSITITTSWAKYTVDWTPSADRTDVQLAITNGAASAMTADCDGIEVYEGLDDISNDAAAFSTGVDSSQPVLTYGRGASFDGSSEAPGFASLPVINDDGKYTPTNSSGVLYGSLDPGRRILIRAVYNAAVYAPFYGTLNRLVPYPMDYHVDLQCVDMLDDLAAASLHVAETTGSFRSARSAALDAQKFTSLNYNTESGATENLYAYRGTNEVSLLAYLEALNLATGTIHWVQPQIYASAPWKLVSRGRTAHSDATTPAETWNDDLSDLSGYDVTREALVNRQRVDATPYEGRARRNQHALVNLQPAWGNVIESTDRKFAVWDADVGGNVPSVSTPLIIPANKSVTLTFDFSTPVTGVAKGVGLSSYAGLTITLDASYSTRVVLTFSAGSADVTFDPDTLVSILGMGLIQTPQNDRDRSDQQSIWLRGEHQGQLISSPYIQHPAQGDALGDWRVWRYTAPRGRPSATHENQFASQLARDVSDRITLTFARLSISGKVFVIRSFVTTVTENSRRWVTVYQLEELPASPAGGWFKLDTSALDGSAVLAY